jgi:RES domain
MKRFTSWDDYRKFARDIKLSRHIHGPSVLRFLESVSEAAKCRAHVIEQEWHFWRAQSGYRGVKVWKPHAAKRMKPMPDRAMEGRVNPKGVPCLYGAKDKLTAIAEIRPWVGEIVSVAVFKVRPNLRVVDCFTEHDHHGFSSLLNVRRVGNKFTKLTMEDIERDIWNHIDRAFSEPISRTDDQGDYIPTQVIAELLKRDKYDGIAYRSRLTENGINVALFDPKVATITDWRELYEVTDLKTIAKPIAP